MVMNERQAATDRQFTDFVQSSRDKFSRMAVMLAGGRSQGEDLLQDALFKTYLAWGRIQPGLAGPYTRRTMVNLATDRWRRRRYEPVIGDEGDRHESLRWSQEYDTVDARDQIVRELAHLTPHERAMVVLRYYADLPEAQVAEELGVSVGTVKSTCSRALARLRPAASSGPIPAGA